MAHGCLKPKLVSNHDHRSLCYHGHVPTLQLLFPFRDVEPETCPTATGGGWDENLGGSFLANGNSPPVKTGHQDMYVNFILYVV